jgi:hypothetical protein
VNLRRCENSRDGLVVAYLALTLRVFGVAIISFFAFTAVSFVVPA